MNPLTKETFIEKAKAVHGDRYDYSKVNYVNIKSKIEIICSAHGSFWQEPNNHLQGNGCPLCARSVSYNKKYYGNTKATNFVEKAKAVHGDRYDYSKVNYVNNGTKVEIICPVHGSFFQTPINHVNHKQDCPKCSHNLKKTKTSFIAEASGVHGDKYDYSKVVYKNEEKKVEIVCSIHGSFWQTPKNHLTGVGCPLCASSKGENAVRKYLGDNNILFEEQKKFEGCKDKYLLSFDFYIPSLKTVIEYNGKQHYTAIEHFGGEKQLHLQRHHDWLKRKYCLKNGIKLIVIRFDESVEEVLKSLDIN